MKKMTCVISTPNASYNYDDANMIVLPTKDGEMAVLYGHMSLIIEVAPGDMKLFKNGNHIKSVHLEDGLIYITNTNVNVFCTAFNVL